MEAEEAESRRGQEQEGLRAGLKARREKKPPGPPVPSDTISALFSSAPSLKLQSP